MRTRVAIVGAGPQALTAAAYLVRGGLDPADLLVLDPSGTWMGSWRAAFARLGIAHLRSAAVHHPDPEPYALTAFARDHRRGTELLHRYGLPTTALFDDFCDEVIARYGLAHRVHPAAVIRLDADGGLHLADGTQLTARHVVWATNPSVSERPGPIPQVDWSADDQPTVAVVGGGLGAAHLAERALEAGAHVEWVLRRPLVIRDFDTDPGWLGPKEMRAFEAEPDPRRRLELVTAARSGGTVPAWIADRLGQAEQRGRVCRRVGAVTIDDHGVAVDGTRLAADRCWLALGDQPALGAAPALDRLCRALGVERVGDRPVLDHALRLPGSNVQVLGRLAQLRLGPTAGNLAGARRGAEAVVGQVLGVEVRYALSS